MRQKDCKISDLNQIFAVKYLSYMPTKEELKRELNLKEFEKLN